VLVRLMSVLRTTSLCSLGLCLSFGRRACARLAYVRPSDDELVLVWLVLRPGYGVTRQVWEGGECLKVTKSVRLVNLRAGLL